MRRRCGALLLVLATPCAVLTAQRLNARPAARDTGPPSRLDSLDMHLDSLLESAPFRATRRAPTVAFLRAPAALPPQPPPDPFAALRLVGVVLGRRPIALLDGVPGVSGARVFAVGDTAHGIRVQRVTVRGATVRANGALRLLALAPP